MCYVALCPRGDEVTSSTLAYISVYRVCDEVTKSDDESLRSLVFRVFLQVMYVSI